MKKKGKGQQYNKLKLEREIDTPQNVPLLRFMSDNLESKGGAVIRAPPPTNAAWVRIPEAMP